MPSYLLVQWLPGEPSAEVAALRSQFDPRTFRTRDVQAKQELLDEVRSWAAEGPVQGLFIGGHGHGVDGEPFDGIGPEGDFLSWMELAVFLESLKHRPDSLHLGACGSADVARAWSEHRVAERLPELSIITHEAHTYTQFVQFALEQSLSDSGWDPFVFLDEELPRLRQATGPVVNMFYTGWVKDNRRVEFVAIDDFPSRVGVTLAQSLSANGSRPLRALRYSSR